MGKYFTTKDGKVCSVRISSNDECGEQFARSQIHDAKAILDMISDIESLCEEDITVSVGKNTFTAPVLAELWDYLDLFLSEVILFWIDDYSLDKYYPYYRDLKAKLKANCG